MDKTIDKSEIRRGRRRRALIWGGGAMAVVGAVAVLLGGMAPTVNSRDITTGVADRGPIEITVAATGRVVPAHEEIINSPVETRLLQVFAQPGDTVEAGTPLLLLDLEEQQTALAKLQDARTMQQQELLQLQLSSAHNRA